MSGYASERWPELLALKLIAGSDSKGLAGNAQSVAFIGIRPEGCGRRPLALQAQAAPGSIPFAIPLCCAADSGKPHGVGIAKTERRKAGVRIGLPVFGFA
jgi:hypothetical protein